MSNGYISGDKVYHSATHEAETPSLKLSQPSQQFILSLINLFLVSEYFLQIRVVDAPCLMQVLCNLIDVGIGTAKELEHFPDLRHIELYDHSVNRHPAEEGAEVRTARQCHVLLDQIKFRLRH